MCGIAGFAGLEDKSLLKRMSGVLAHRGPDDEGFYSSGAVGLANRRLSVIDIEGGHQPVHNEDETVWVAYNGEVYNFPDLRTELEAAGHRFYTLSDTEVLAHAYEEFGDEFVTKLNGMFGITV